MLLYEMEKSVYANWVFPNQATIMSDFAEYKHKENSKWKGRAQQMGFRFPIFDTVQDFETALQSAPIINLTAELDREITNRSHTSSINGLKSLVNSYSNPRDVDRIVQGFQTNAKIPMPIILKGRHGMWIMAGNTRLDTAFILGVQPKVLMVDVSA